MARLLRKGLEMMRLSARDYHHTSRDVSALRQARDLRVSLFVGSQHTHPFSYQNPRGVEDCGGYIPTKQYRLPGSPSTDLHKQSILDPTASLKQYRLPAQVTSIQEKLSPSLLPAPRVEDPHPLQRVIESGGSVEKLAMPWLVRVRTRMHKRHRQEKRKKRDVYLNRKLLRVRRAKKEAKMQLVEQKWRDMEQTIDPQNHYEQRRDAAKKGGWRDNSIFEQLKKMDKEAKRRKELK